MTVVTIDIPTTNVAELRIVRVVNVKIIVLNLSCHSFTPSGFP